MKENRVGGDDAIRPEFPPDPSELAPYGWETYRIHQHLIGLRRRHPWLHRARTRTLHLTNTQLVLEIGERLILALNLDEHPVDVPAPAITTVLAGTADLSHSGVARLNSHGWAILE